MKIIKWKRDQEFSLSLYKKRRSTFPMFSELKYPEYFTMQWHLFNYYFLSLPTERAWYTRPGSVLLQTHQGFVWYHHSDHHPTRQRHQTHQRLHNKMDACRQATKTRADGGRRRYVCYGHDRQQFTGNVIIHVHLFSSLFSLSFPPFSSFISSFPPSPSLIE